MLETVIVREILLSFHLNTLAMQLEINSLRNSSVLSEEQIHSDMATLLVYSMSARNCLITWSNYFHISVSNHRHLYLRLAFDRYLSLQTVFSLSMVYFTSILQEQLFEIERNNRCCYLHCLLNWQWKNHHKDRLHHPPWGVVEGNNAQQATLD